LLLALLLLLLLPMLLLGLIVGGVSSHSSKTKLLMYGGHRSMSAPKAAYHKQRTAHSTRRGKCERHHSLQIHFRYLTYLKHFLRISAAWFSWVC
jgi:hypothetical protein